MLLAVSYLIGIKIGLCRKFSGRRDTNMFVYVKKIYRFLLLCGVVLILLGTVGTQSAQAEGEKAYFGSESYEWEVGIETMIGIYISADQTLGTVDYIIAYDPNALQHTSGEEEVEEGKIRIHGENLGGTEYKRLIYFKPLQGGNTKITVDEVQVSDADGNVESAAAVTALIHVPIPESCRLDSIILGGEEISDFDGEQTDYTIEVESDVEQVLIDTTPSDINTEISDTKLNIGTNDIQVVASDGAGNEAVYTLHVIRSEPVQVKDTEEEEVFNNQSEQWPDREKTLNLSDYQHSIYGFMAWCRNCLKEILINHKVFSVLIGGLFILFLILVIVKIRIKKKNKLNAKKVISRSNEIVQSEIKSLGTDNAEIEISIKNVTMDFVRDNDESSSIKELIIRTIKRQRHVEYFRALDNISFDVKTGEVVGIIGTNGSGKSTILKIISGVLTPTKGTVSVNKNKIQLLTLGTGFDRELTGKENVYLNGALIGYSKEYIDKKYDDIVRFAELEGFMEERVKNYSSGMVSRLGFAIATARSTPEILILDEVLSVGDIFFRKKSEKRIQEMIHGGSTVLIVSHSTAVIRNNCTKVVWIERGRLRAIGEPKKVCDAYEKMNS